MANDKLVPSVLFSMILAGILLLFPIFKVRADEFQALSITHNLDLILAALFFVVCCLAADFSKWPKFMISLAPVGTVLVLLIDTQVRDTLLEPNLEELRNAFIVGLALLILAIFLQLNSKNFHHILSDETEVFRNPGSLLSKRPM